MISRLDIRLMPEEAADPTRIRAAVERALPSGAGVLRDYRVVRRSIDARQRRVMVQMAVAVATGDDATAVPDVPAPVYRDVSSAFRSLVIVGAGPAGLFAALRCLEAGVRPIVVERGLSVDERRLTLAAISRSGVVDPDTNYCFGEGGAGAYSDGKLFTRSKKRGDVSAVLAALHAHGADESILVDAHPHIGSDRLPGIIHNMRNTILDHGGEVHFGTRVTDIMVRGGRAAGVVTTEGEIEARGVLLATGHSARDVYEMLDRLGVAMEAKGIAIGVRLEHPQALIDSIRYHIRGSRGSLLPPAEYSYVAQCAGRGVYSFCMCPGGVVVPAASAPCELVVNGMSASGRSGRLANSGIVVEVRPGDFPEYDKYGVFAHLRLQQDLERAFFMDGGEGLNAPAQRMTDFAARRDSRGELQRTTYAPGVHSGRLDRLLPEQIASRLAEGFRAFDCKNPGFMTPDGLMIGLESRTSAPVRVPRDPVTREHPGLPGLYPVGEGAGYAGGIVSAGMDGMASADAFAHSSGVF